MHAADHGELVVAAFRRTADPPSDKGARGMRLTLVALALLAPAMALAQPIDRQALVTRHNPTLTAVDRHAPLMLGNGNLGFTADITGLQTFPEAYSKLAPLLTMAQWSWHSFPNPAGYIEADGQVMVAVPGRGERSEEHTSELQSPCNLVCRLLLEKKKEI